MLCAYHDTSSCFTARLWKRVIQLDLVEVPREGRVDISVRWPQLAWPVCSDTMEVLLKCRVMKRSSPTSGVTTRLVVADVTERRPTLTIIKDVLYNEIVEMSGSFGCASSLREGKTLRDILLVGNFTASSSYKQGEELSCHHENDLCLMIVNIRYQFVLVYYLKLLLTGLHSKRSSYG